MTALFAATKVWWYLSRASGFTTYVLLIMSAVLGIALATRALGKNVTAPWLLSVHRFASGFAFVFLAIHMFSLLGDKYIQFTVADLLVPGSSTWQTTAMTLGIISMYLLVIIEVSSLLRNRLNKRLWRMVHFLSYAVLAGATTHAVMAGTDAKGIAAILLFLFSGGLLLFFLSYRWIGPGRVASVKDS